MSTVSALYDALFTFEERHRGPGAYPVHKRLSFPDGQYADVYDWIAHELAVGAGDHVLDVGCGVGFGTIRLVERGAGHATGITISPRELARARAASSFTRHVRDVDFLHGSFDGLPRRAFDVAVAVESLKHSAELGTTVRAVLGSVVRPGRAVFVDDVFFGDPLGADAGRVAEDWMLTRLYTLDDYVDALDDTAFRVVDLTSTVPRRPRPVLALRLALLKAAAWWSGSRSRPTALRAFRGGIHLERLYARGAMRYLAFVVTGHGTEGTP